MEQSLPSEVESSVLTFRNSLEKVEMMVKPLLEQPLTAKTSKMDPESRAKVNLCCAYTVNTLFYCKFNDDDDDDQNNVLVYLKTQGINPEDHPIKQEINRIQLYFKKLKEKQLKKSLDSASSSTTTTNDEEVDGEESTGTITNTTEANDDAENKKRKNKTSDNKQQKKKKK